MEPRLAVILVADVVGYSRLMRENEAGTLDALRTRCEELVEPKITVECCLAHLAQSAVARWRACWTTGVALREPWIS
jgi:hypothetical protein